MDDRPIGIFDSGLGGLTVMKEMMTCLPDESIVYFGDTARIPYGTRSPEIVIRYSIQCIRFLLTQNIKMVVIGCNTASSVALNAVRGIFDLPIVGVIQPGAIAAVKATKNKKVGVIGTEGTIKSRAYNDAIAAIDDGVKVFDAACPLLVPIVEEGWGDTEIAHLTAVKYLYKLRSEEVDTLVLGCTHYPLLMNSISAVMGPGVNLVNPAVGVANQVKDILETSGMNNTGASDPMHCFFVSDFGQRFRQIGSGFLGRDIDHAERVHIEGY